MVTANCIHCGRLIEVDSLTTMADCGCQENNDPNLED